MGEWTEDILGAGYERRTIELGQDPDGEGEITATLVRRRTDAERQRVDAALAALRDAAALWRIDPAAGCSPAEVVLTAPVLGLGAAAAPAGKDGHADLEARWDFSCRDGTRAGFVEHGLFAAFARLGRLEVQAVTPRGQMKVVLRKPAGRIALAR